MDTKVEHWPLLTFKEYEKDINPSPTYQRHSVWKTEQKQLLLDSILRRIDIPKLYLRETSGPFSYEIIDGQQRMRAIWEFLSDGFPLSNESEDVLLGDKLFAIGGVNYGGLPTKLKLERIHKYTLDVVIIQQATEDEIADLFYRLNNGTPLKPAEVRNAMPGEMTQAVRDLAKHPFFSKVSFGNLRFAHDQVAAQLMLLETNGGPCDIPDRLLTRMYAEYSKGVPPARLKKVRDVLTTLDKIFPSQSRVLNRAQTVNLYLLVSMVMSNGRLPKPLSQVLAWYQKSEAKRLQDSEYKLHMVSAANSRRAIEERFKHVLFDFTTEFHEALSLKLDARRIFSDEMKIQLYARDSGTCQNSTCRKKLDEFDWHADHVTPWIRGGRTTLENGQVLCVKCNLRKKDRLWT